MQNDILTKLPVDLLQHVATYRVETYPLTVVCTRCDKPLVFLTADSEMRQREMYFATRELYLCAACYKEMFFQVLKGAD